MWEPNTVPESIENACLARHAREFIDAGLRGAQIAYAGV